MLFTIAVRNLFRNKIRSFLTLLGIAIGVSLFSSALTITSNFEQETHDLIKSYQLDIMVQSKDAATPIVSKIPLTYYSQINKIKGVKNTSAMVLGSIKSEWSPYFLIIGISSIDMLSQKIFMKEGRFFSPEKKEIIWGDEALKKVKVKINDKVSFSEDDIYSIVGIYATGHHLIDGGIILNIEDAQKILKKDDYVNMIFISVDKNISPKEVIKQINQQFPALFANISGDFFKQVRLFQTIESFAWVISAIALITCCIVVMNTFFMVISERIKEIGILTAVGWSKWMVMRIILWEALLLSAIGSLAGNLLGCAYLWLFNMSDTVGFGWLPPGIPWKIILLSVQLSMVAGILGSIYPAFVAARLLPAEALRHE